jgi:hypothetical protein
MIASEGLSRHKKTSTANIVRSLNGVYDYGLAILNREQRRVMHMTGRHGFPEPKPLISIFFILALCIISGCIQGDDMRKGESHQEPGILAGNESADAVAIALNDNEVQDYLRNGYTMGNVGPLCYERSPGDGKIYKLCFTGVEFTTPDVFLVVYVDTKKGEVNKTSAMYNRNPVVPVKTKMP